MEGALRRIALLGALAACGGRESDVAAPSDLSPRLQLVRCSVATPPPVIADDGVSFGGLTKAEVLELKRGSRIGDAGPGVMIAIPTVSGALAPPAIAWTPFALDGSPPLDVAPVIASAAEIAMRARLDRLALCFRGPTPAGSLRAMLDIDPTGLLRAARIGGLGDEASAACLRRELAGLQVKSPTLDAAEVACDLARGDARRWRVLPSEYEVIRATRTGLEHAGTRIGIGASEPDPLPGNRVYLVLADQDTPGTVLELALTWAFDGDATLVAITDGTSTPPLLGVGRSTFALGDPHDDPIAAPVSIEIYRDRVMVCTGSSSQEARLADGAKALDILGTRLATHCRSGRCASTIGLAVDGDAPATSLPPIVDALRRAGFERVLIGGGLGCRPSP